jgi:hypothetical protein
MGGGGRGDLTFEHFKAFVCLYGILAFLRCSAAPGIERKHGSQAFGGCVASHEPDLQIVTYCTNI